MNVKKITLRIQKEIGAVVIQMTEMPIPDQFFPKDLGHLIIVNAGPVFLELSNPEATLNCCLIIFNKIVLLLGSLKECVSTRFSISIFIPPGDQSSRILCGFVDTGKKPLRLGEKLCIHEIRSNVKSVHQLIESLGDTLMSP